MNTLPAVGTYLMPVQAYLVRYCEQVLEAIDCTESHAPGMKALKLRRWGLDDQRQPFDDGHCDVHSHSSWKVGRFRPVGSRAWRINDEAPLYFKQIPAPTVAGQLDLFS